MSTKGIVLALLMLAATACLLPPSAPVQPQEILQAQSSGRMPLPIDDSHIAKGDGPPEMTKKQQSNLLKANLEKSKKDAAELASLARELREELNKSNANALSDASLLRVEKIERLAKKIRNELGGY
jgi:hypothetical protein